jgi:hypothetical protein
MIHLKHGIKIEKNGWEMDRLKNRKSTLLMGHQVSTPQKMKAKLQARVFKVHPAQVAQGRLRHSTPGIATAAEKRMTSMPHDPPLFLNSMKTITNPN